MRNWITGFDSPAFFYALTTLLLLLTLYWFHRRSTVKRTSAIFLWDRPETSPESGSRRMFRHLPLSFYLEALALVFLVLAAAGPFRMGMESYPALAVVLDNSFSMRAEAAAGESPRTVGEVELKKIFDRFPGRRILLVLAGRESRLLSDGRTVPSLERWNAEDAAADLPAALALARSRAPTAEFLIVSDRKPDFPLPEDVGVLATGKPMGNVALVNVRRNAETILVEVLNASHLEQRIILKLLPGGTVADTQLAAGERRKLVFRIPDSLLAQSLNLVLESAADPLSFDNLLTLLPEDDTPVGIRFAENLPDELARELNAVLVDNPDYRQNSVPELVSGLFDLPSGNFHRLHWNPGNPERTRVSAEPLSVRAGHPLTRGISTEGVRWAADPEIKLPGEILLRSGDAELISFRRRLDGYCDIFLNLAPEASNVSRTPVWPVLFWNIADFLRSERPGPGKRNRRNGEVVEVKVASGVKEVRVRCADGSTRSVIPLKRAALLAGLPPGVNRIVAEEAEWQVAVSSLSADESNLDAAGTYHGNALRVTGMDENPRFPLGWIALFLATIVLMVHQYELGTKKRGGA